MKFEKSVESENHVYADLGCGVDGDEVAIKRNRELLKKEMMKPKPKSEVIISLIKRTLVPRRNWIMDGCRPAKVMDQYPHLKKCCYVSIIYIVCVNCINYLCFFFHLDRFLVNSICL